ncbi:MAG: flippase-like domain-containing protein [Proteobacteria bacterium]|nr:flippase-like domain-containing protein [Pseudomonadota bacterium]
MQAANAEIDFIQSAFLISISALVLILPITLNGIGLHEGVIFVFLSRVGLDPETALLVALYPRIGLIIFSLFGGILYAFSLGGQKASPKGV